ncbi:hypothetical protein [Neisseria sp.]|uniref:hypothetical protein n=1 Tax=Neisseria sp. TaxID=192066 RepID=UPI00359F44B4
MKNFILMFVWCICLTLFPTSKAVANCTVDEKAVFAESCINPPTPIPQGQKQLENKPVAIPTSIGQAVRTQKPNEVHSNTDVFGVPATANNSGNTPQKAPVVNKISVSPTPKKPKNRKSLPVTVLTAAESIKPKVKLTPQQALQNEIKNEQAALLKTQAQLNLARKNKLTDKVIRLEKILKDRQANLRAFQKEIR